MELVAEGFNFPTSFAFDEEGEVFVAESGLPFAGAKPGGRVLKIDKSGGGTCLKESLRQPVNGLLYWKGGFYISEGGYPGRISRLDLNGNWSTVLDELPGMGNYHTNMAVIGPDEKLYFSQGALTNSGIIGLDAYDIGWLNRLPHNADVPGYDIVLTGINIETANPLDEKSGGRTETGAFSAFGMKTTPGQIVKGRVPCTASVMRCNPDGSELELVAWGLRNAYGLVFLPDGRLLATDQGADDRGSRPIGNSPDFLFEVSQGKWYGWPDFVGGIPVIDQSLLPERGPAPQMLLANHAELPEPERPLLAFPAHVAAVKLAVAPKGHQWAQHVFVALFGDEVPMTGPAGPRVGRSIARIDPVDWSLHEVPGSRLNRPIDVKFHPVSGEMYVLDFGEFEITSSMSIAAKAGSGKLWKGAL